MENKNNISKEDFLKLFDSNEPKDLEHLDDFEKEALEGLKMMKNPSIVNSIDAKIDTKLAELVAAEKKGGKRAGMYFLSIAASIALVIGLFFIFKKAEPSLKEEVAVVKDKESNDATGAITDAEPKLNSDGKIVSEQPELKKELAPNKPLPPLEEKTVESISYAEKGKEITLSSGITKNEYKKEAEGYIADDRKEVVATPPVMAGEVMNDESVVLKNKDKDGVADLEENKVVVTDNIKYTENDSKKDEAIKSKASKKTAETKNRAVVPSVNESISLSQVATGTSINTNNNTNTFTSTPGNTNGTIVNSTISANSVSNNKASNHVNSEFVGGKKALDEYIKKNLKIPATCLSEEIVIVKFEVSEAGKISKVKVASKTGNCPDCEKEAINFVKNMPNWKAATQDGKPIVSKQQVELSFKK